MSLALNELFVPASSGSEAIAVALKPGEPWPNDSRLDAIRDVISRRIGLSGRQLVTPTANQIAASPHRLMFVVNKYPHINRSRVEAALS